MRPRTLRTRIRLSWLSYLSKTSYSRMQYRFETFVTWSRRESLVKLCSIANRADFAMCNTNRFVAGRRKWEKLTRSLDTKYFQALWLFLQIRHPQVYFAEITLRFSTKLLMLKFAISFRFFFLTFFELKAIKSKQTRFYFPLVGAYASYRRKISKFDYDFVGYRCALKECNENGFWASPGKFALWSFEAGSLIQLPVNVVFGVGVGETRAVMTRRRPTSRYCTLRAAPCIGSTTAFITFRGWRDYDGGYAVGRVWILIYSRESRHKATISRRAWSETRHRLARMFVRTPSRYNDDGDDLRWLSGNAVPCTPFFFSRFPIQGRK